MPTVGRKGEVPKRWMEDIGKFKNFGSDPRGPDSSVTSWQRTAPHFPDAKEVSVPDPGREKKAYR